MSAKSYAAAAAGVVLATAALLSAPAPAVPPLSASPSAAPSGSPSAAPSGSPSAAPSGSPSVAPSPSGSGPVAAAVDCAAVPRYETGLLPADTPGDLVPAGAATVTRCETALTPSPPALAPPAVVTAGAADFARLLNALPAATAGQACLRVAFATQVSFVFTFDPATRRDPQVVVVDRNCAALVTVDGYASRARSYATLDPMPVFELLLARSAPGPSLTP
jgi:hypothetical protein